MGSLKQGGKMSSLIANIKNQTLVSKYDLTNKETILITLLINKLPDDFTINDLTLSITTEEYKNYSSVNMNVFHSCFYVCII